MFRAVDGMRYARRKGDHILLTLTTKYFRVYFSLLIDLMGLGVCVVHA